VLLAAGAVWLARRRVVAGKQHRRESMPDASERSLTVGEDWGRGNPPPPPSQ